MSYVPHALDMVIKRTKLFYTLICIWRQGEIMFSWLGNKLRQDMSFAYLSNSVYPICSYAFMLRKLTEKCRGNNKLIMMFSSRKLRKTDCPQSQLICQCRSCMGNLNCIFRMKDMNSNFRLVTYVQSDHFLIEIILL